MAAATLTVLGGRLVRHPPLFSHDSSLLYASVASCLKVFRVPDGRLIRSVQLSPPKSNGEDLHRRVLERIPKDDVLVRKTPFSMKDISSLSWNGDHLLVSFFGGSICTFDKDFKGVRSEFIKDKVVLKAFYYESQLFVLCLSLKSQLQTELLRLSPSKGQESVFCYSGFPVYAFHQHRALFGFNKSLISIAITDQKPIWSQTRHPKPITSLAIKDNHHVLVGDQDGVITEYTELNSKHRTLMHWHSDRVQALCCASHLFMSGGAESVLVYWRGPRDRDFLSRLGQEGGILSLVLAPDQRYVSVSLNDNTIHLVNTHTNTSEYSLAGLKAVSTNILAVEPTRNLILTDSELVGHMQLYDHTLDTAFDDLQVSPQVWISSTKSAPIVFQHAIYGHDGTHLWMVTSEKRTECQALRFWTLNPDSKYHLRTLLEDPHAGDVSTLCKASSGNELIFATADASSFKLWTQITLPKRNEPEARPSWKCAFAGRHNDIRWMDICFWNEFALLAIVDGSHLNLYEYFGGQVELASRVDIKTCAKCLFVRNHLVVFTADKQMLVYAIQDNDDKLSLYLIHSLNVTMVDAAVSREGVLAVLTLDHLSIFSDVTSKTAHDHPIIANRICWLNSGTIIAMDAEHRLIRQQIQPLLQEAREIREHTATPINSIFTAPIVSLTPPAEKEAPSSKKRRVKRKELSKEAGILRDFVSSHELPSVDRLFDELVQE